MQCATMNKIIVISFNFLVALVDKKYVRSTYFVHLMFALMDYNHFKPTAGVPAELSNHKPLPRRLFQVSPGWNSRWITTDDYWQWQHFLLILYWCFELIPTVMILLMLSVSVNKMNHQVLLRDTVGHKIRGRLRRSISWLSAGSLTFCYKKNLLATMATRFWNLVAICRHWQPGEYFSTPLQMWYQILDYIFKNK